MKRIGVASLLIGTLMLGCSHHESNSEPAMTPASRAGTDNERAIFAITEQRCKRELNCNNIGPDKTYSSEDACRSQLNSKGYESLNEDRCPKGIDPNALESCMRSIQGEDCGNPIDTIERFADCRSGKLCAD